MQINRALLSIAIIEEALDALRENGLRTVLSLIGVAVGISAIVVVNSIGKSGHQMIFSELETFGLRTLWVSRAQESNLSLAKGVAGSGMDVFDYHELRKQCCVPVSLISPIIELGGRGEYAKKMGIQVPIRLVGVNEDYAAISHEIIADGHFITAQDVASGNNVAVIGSSVKNQLFGQLESPIGQRFLIEDSWYVVIGVLQNKSRDLISSIGAGREDTATRVLIPYTAHQKLIGDRTYVSYLQAQSSSTEQSADAIELITSTLKRRHRGLFTYKAESMATYIEAANHILNGVTLIGVVAAAVSLIVGGLAIMNIMTTSVIERTKEIGLRRAIGASKWDIRLQFLLEAVFIGFFGGALGAIFGLIIIEVLARTTILPVELSTDGLIVGLFCSSLVGLISGYYPAHKAASLPPVVALRYE
ncbi:MAG: ABC transporter permease [Gallionella sp.]